MTAHKAEFHWLQETNNEEIKWNCNCKNMLFFVYVKEEFLRVFLNNDQYYYYFFLLFSFHILFLIFSDETETGWSDTSRVLQLSMIRKRLMCSVGHLTETTTMVSL